MGKPEALELLKRLELCQILTRFFDSQLLHPRAQGARIDAEQFGRALFAVNDPASFAHSPDDVITLIVLESVDERRSRDGLVRAQHRLIDLHDGAFGENHRALDNILQFANITGPRRSE